jgi:hypothetical protein
VPSGRPFELNLANVGLDLVEVLAGLALWRIPPGAKLVLRLPDGVHVQHRAVEIDHPDGARLAIIGNTAQPDRCCLAWNGASDGIYVGPGAVLGSIDGVLLEHRAPERRGLGSGVLADHGGVVRCGPKVWVRNFYYGFQARYGAIIACDGTRSEGGGDANYFAFSGGHIQAQGATALGARDAEKALGSGFVAEYGGTINATDAIARRNLLAGFNALSNGSIRAYGALAERNGRAGFMADTGGVIVAHGALARGNCGAGVLARERSTAVTGNRLLSEDNGPESAACKAAPA